MRSSTYPSNCFWRNASALNSTQGQTVRLLGSFWLQVVSGPRSSHRRVTLSRRGVGAKVHRRGTKAPHSQKCWRQWHSPFEAPRPRGLKFDKPSFQSLSVACILRNLNVSCTSLTDSIPGCGDSSLRARESMSISRGLGISGSNTPLPLNVSSEAQTTRRSQVCRSDRDEKMCCWG